MRRSRRTRPTQTTPGGDDHQHLRVDEAAKLMRVHWTTVQYWCRTGQLRHYEDLSGFRIPTEAIEEFRQRHRLTVGRVAGHIYRQITAVIGAFAMLAFLSLFANFHWSGQLATLMDVWNKYFRPPPRWLLHYAIETPAGWFGWHGELPLWLRDYLAVGFVLFISHIRILVSEQGRSRVLANIFADKPQWNPAGVHPVLYLLLWPMAIPLAVLEIALETSSGGRKEPWLVAQILSPLLYAGVLLAVNFVVL